MGRPALYSTTREVPRLEVRDLARRGLLRPGTWTTWGWNRGGEHLVTVALTAREDGLHVAHGERAYVVDVEREPLPYGGTRPWFLCPAYPCGRRCGVLYLRGGLFACRTCHRLVYPSTREQRGDRLLRRLRGVMARLGAEWDAHPYRVPKPPRMRWRTYERLQEEALALEEEIGRAHV